jgi:Glycosyl transferase family 2
MSPLLSVAIPTHNRAGYAIHAIRSLLALGDQRMELVVSDTSSDGELGRLIAADAALQDDPRLNYFNPAERLDMTGNHNAALAACKGEYVCLIGDDDTLATEILEAVEWARLHEVDLIAPNVVANYAWPDFRSRYFGKGHAARLYYRTKLGAATVVEGTEAFATALRNAGQGTEGLPKIYHGIVRRRVLQEIRDRSGAYFHGSSPDVSGAVGLAMCCQRFLVVDYPLTIPGGSGGSNTGRSAMNTHKGSLGQESQTRSFESGGWSDGVPRFFSVETVWAHATLETIRRMDAARIRDYNFARLLAACTVLHGEFAAEIEQATSDAAAIVGLSPAAMAAAVAVERRRFRNARLRHLCKRALRPTAAGGRHYVGGLETVALAPPILAAKLRELGIAWADIARRLPVN